MGEPPHLHPTAQAASRALLPDDPGRALALAQALLDAPLMLNHNRGLWGYSGRAADGEPLTIQSTGIGGPSAAIVVRELADLGVAEMIRVGTCEALTGDLALGEIIVVSEAVAADGTSRSLDAGRRAAADPWLTAALDGDRTAVIASHDALYDPQAQRRRAEWAADGALACDLETAAVLQAAALAGVRAACVLAVTSAPAGRLSHDDVVAAGDRLGQVAAAALTRVAG